ncbi:MAG: hypothetical protein JW788_02330 [Candidatus Omnitrophica bacterium]|nr:hypothetical protein [Candidatus Omnitrophota bacterium]
MTEHRLIERVIKLWEAELKRIDKNKRADPYFIDKAVDCMYEKKRLSPEISKILQELVDE